MQNETIVDRVVARLKAQPLGDLITEEDLHDIVKEALPKTFFEKRRIVQQSSYGRNEVQEIEPLILEIMRGLLKEKVAEIARAWHDEHKEELFLYWKRVMDEGLMTYVQRLQNEQATVAVRSALQPLIRTINEERANHGLPQLFL